MSGRRVIAIGVFDGVHLGHKKIFKKALDIARRRRAKAAVVTFNPHPASVISPKAAPMSLISVEHRLRLIRQSGIGSITVFDFTKEFSKIEPERFIKDVLIERLKAGCVVVGEDFRFGRSGQGNSAFLKRFGRPLGLDVKIVRPLKYKGRAVSSSLIRQAILSGRLDFAKRLLGRPPGILGTVVKGNSRGRTLGFPTANINPHHEVVPPSGVYAVKVRIGDRQYRGVLNIGSRPTFYGPAKQDREPTIEVHIFDFSGRIYGEVAEVLFVRRLRPEKRFLNKTALTAQIKKDIDQARKNLN
jgi:riboflavin kinase/FMN adenylyltransferase